MDAKVETEPVFDRRVSRTILLVEDDRAVRRYMEILLQRAGFSVVAAADGLEAMKLALSTKFDLVITDAIMPQLNGYELCRFLRRHPHLARVPIVLLSGAERNGDESIKPDAYLTKPVQPEQLSACLAKLIEGASDV